MCLRTHLVVSFSVLVMGDSCMLDFCKLKHSLCLLSIWVRGIILQRLMDSYRCPLSLHTGIKKVLHSMSSDNLSWLGAVRTDFQKSLCWLALALVLAPVRFLFTALAALASMRFLIISCLWRSSVLLLLLTDTFCPIQGFFNLPDFWLNNLGVAFLCLLYFQRIKSLQLY